MPIKKYFHEAEATTFLRNHYNESNLRAKALGEGDWSQAFAFSRHGQNRVLRLGKYKADFIKDQNANRYASPKLPIPIVHEVGIISDGYFAISERIFGTLLDSLDGSEMQAVAPEIFATFDAIRETDISDTYGFGMAGTDTNAPFGSWAEYLLDVANGPSRTPGRPTNDWRSVLDRNVDNKKNFEASLALLNELCQDLPETRYLVHNDFLHHNVLVNHSRISGVFDWALALYGDFLYDLCHFVFWDYYYPALSNIDWTKEAKVHFQAIGLQVPMFQERLLACQLHIGLDAQTYFASTNNLKSLSRVSNRTFALTQSTR